MNSYENDRFWDIVIRNDLDLVADRVRDDLINEITKHPGLRGLARAALFGQYVDRGRQVNVQNSIIRDCGVDEEIVSLAFTRSYVQQHEAQLLLREGTNIGVQRGC